MDTIQKLYPDAYVALDLAARDCGYPRPWFVWSTQDDDMRMLGEGRTEAEALRDALNNVDP